MERFGKSEKNVSINKSPLIFYQFASYPENSLEAYSHNSRCAWLIKTNHTKVLKVTFSKFDIEDSRDCKFDWLQVRMTKANPPAAFELIGDSSTRFTMVDHHHHT